MADTPFRGEDIAALAHALLGLSVVESKHLAGSKRPVQQGRVLYVSPAMMDLIRHADQQELRHLLANLRPIMIPEFNVYESLPMTTVVPPGKFGRSSDGEG